MAAATLCLVADDDRYLGVVAVAGVGGDRCNSNHMASGDGPQKWPVRKDLVAWVEAGARVKDVQVEANPLVAC